MNRHTAELDHALEQLRHNHAFMSNILRRPAISDFLGLGTFTGGVWKKRIGSRSLYNRKATTFTLAPAEAFQAVDMRQLLYALYWTMLARTPSRKEPMECVGDDAFWKEFLALGQAAQWQPRPLHRALLNATSASLPSPVRLHSWLYFFTKCRTPGNYGTRLPDEAFLPFDHVVFSPKQRERWENLAGFGTEALFKKQVFRANLAVDLSFATLTDWFSFALARRRADIVCHWLENQPEKSLGLSHREVLLYVAANFHGDYAARVINCLEKLAPGICAGFRDRHDHNLLWYTADCWQLRRSGAHADRYPQANVPGTVGHAWQLLAKEHGDPNGRSSSNHKLLQTLFRLGISPFQSNHYGFSFQHLDEAGRMMRQRWQTTRIRQEAPGFDDHAFWHLDPHLSLAAPQMQVHPSGTAARP